MNGRLGTTAVGHAVRVKCQGRVNATIHFRSTEEDTATEIQCRRMAANQDHVQSMATGADGRHGNRAARNAEGGFRRDFADATVLNRTTVATVVLATTPNEDPVT